MASPLTLAEFKDLLETYGTDLARWPGDRRATAETLLTESAGARTLYADLYGDLAAVEALFGKRQPSADLAERIRRKSED
jgi:hypothetical protein